jgi:hypothetical protein
MRKCFVSKSVSDYRWKGNGKKRYALETYHRFTGRIKTPMFIPGIKEMLIKKITVGFKKPNALGFYDMDGNVWNWTLTNHESDGKVVRGVSWRNGIGSLKSSHRINNFPTHKFHYVGFCCATSRKLG